MRLAILADIHGNLLALEAVLADVATRHVDLTVNLGDLVSGPLQPRETADLLMSLNLPTICGNHERNLLSQPLESMGASDRFARQFLHSAHLEWLASLPETLKLDEDILLCHGTPASDTDYLLESIDEQGFRLATDTEVTARITSTSASLILCGHSHLPRLANLSAGQTIVNPGSVGVQAYHAEWPHPHTVSTGSPHARYAIADQQGQTWSIEFLEVAYDWDSAAQLAASNRRPDWVTPLLTGNV